MKTIVQKAKLHWKNNHIVIFAMQQRVWFMLLVAAICSLNSFAQTKVQIGDLYYNLYGSYASVANNSNSVYPGKCYYTNDSYIIPSIVAYNGLDYVVNEIGKLAFGPYNTHWGTTGSTVSSIILPNTIQYIRELAFYNCENLSAIMIPASVESLGDKPFEGCNTLRETIYLPKSAPIGWGAAGKTYVPDKISYSNPSYSINYANVIEMISFEQTEFDYTGKVPTTTWHNNVEGYTASLNMPSLIGEAGEHEVWIPVTFTKADESFTVNVVYRYTVKPAKLTVKVANASREYGEENPDFNVSYFGFVNGESKSVITTNPTVSTTAIKTSDVGDYPITINGGNAANYELVYEPGVLTVTKAPLSARVNDATKVYGAQNPAFTIEYYGLKNNETTPAWIIQPTFQTDATESSNVGQYTVKAINAVPVNYNMGEIAAGILTITSAPLTIKANDAVRQYYSEEPNFTYTCNGFVNGDNENILSSNPTFSTSATESSNVGTYEIKISGASSENYSISYVNGTLTITPRTLIASVGNYERLYNEENPAFEIVYDGFMGNDDVNTLSTKPVTKTAATKTSDVGTYKIDVTGGIAENYSFNYISGTLTVYKAEQTISWEQDLSELKVGDQVELKAVASSGLPITYSMDYNSAAEIYSAGNKSYLDCKAGGSFLIRAVQGGNKNYYSSPRASNTITISGSNPPSDPVLTIKQADNGSVKVQVSKGSVYTFTFAPSNDWKIHSVTFNNTDVTSQLSGDGKFTTPAITSNSTLYVVYEQGNSSVNAAKTSDVKVQVTSGGFKIVDATIGETINVYTTGGLLQHSVKAYSQVVDIPLTNHEVYIVKIGTKTMKLNY